MLGQIVWCKNWFTVSQIKTKTILCRLYRKPSSLIWLIDFPTGGQGSRTSSIWGVSETESGITSSETTRVPEAEDEEYGGSRADSTSTRTGVQCISFISLFLKLTLKPWPWQCDLLSPFFWLPQTHSETMAITVWSISPLFLSSSNTGWIQV